MNRQTLIVVAIALLLIGGTGYFAYTRGVDAGYAQANDVRTEFFRARGITTGAGGTGFAGGGGAAATGAAGGGGAAATAGGGAGGGAGGRGGTGGAGGTGFAGRG